MTSKKRRLPTSSELVLVDGLLSMLSRRMTGALDLGLVLLLESPRERYQQYVEEHVARPMRAAGLVLRLAVAEAVPEPALTPFESVNLQTEAFLGALDELGGFESLPSAELKEAVELLRTSFRRLNDSLADIAERLGFEPTALDDSSSGLDYDGVLRRLHGDLMAERERGAPN